MMEDRAYCNPLQAVHNNHQLNTPTHVDVAGDYEVNQYFPLGICCPYEPVFSPGTTDSDASGVDYMGPSSTKSSENSCENFDVEKQSVLLAESGAGADLSQNTSADEIVNLSNPPSTSPPVAMSPESNGDTLLPSMESDLESLHNTFAFGPNSLLGLEFIIDDPDVMPSVLLAESGAGADISQNTSADEIVILNNPPSTSPPVDIYPESSDEASDLESLNRTCAVGPNNLLTFIVNNPDVMHLSEEERINSFLTNEPQDASISESMTTTIPSPFTTLMSENVDVSIRAPCQPSLPTPPPNPYIVNIINDSNSGLVATNTTPQPATSDFSSSNNSISDVAEPTLSADFPRNDNINGESVRAVVSSSHRISRGKGKTRKMGTHQEKTLHAEPSTKKRKMGTHQEETLHAEPSTKKRKMGTQQEKTLHAEPSTASLDVAKIIKTFKDIHGDQEVKVVKVFTQTGIKYVCVVPVVPSQGQSELVPTTQPAAIHSSRLNSSLPKQPGCSKRIVKQPARYQDSGSFASSTNDGDISDDNVVSNCEELKIRKNSLEGLTDGQKYNRMRAQNNKSSKKCREKTKVKKRELARNLDEEERRHEELTATLRKKDELAERLKTWIMQILQPKSK